MIFNSMFIVIFKISYKNKTGLVIVKQIRDFMTFFGTTI